VRIGSRSIIGAGSVVTRDIPDDTFAAGNPCRIIRKLTEKPRPDGPI
jgi:maltose O-acetyltransferase